MKEIRVAVAGVGNPDRFCATLMQLGLTPALVAFVDHHRFVAADLFFDDDLPIVLTEKDAVKIRRVDRSDIPERCWYLEIDAVMTESAEAALNVCLATRGIVPREAA